MVSSASLLEAKLIYISQTGNGSPTCLCLAIMVVQLWMVCCGLIRGQELCHEAAAAHRHTLLTWLLLERGPLLVGRVRVEQPLITAFQRRVEFRRRVAPVRQQELNVPRCPAVVVQELLCHLLGDLQLLGDAGFVTEGVQRQRAALRLPHLDVCREEQTTGSHFYKSILKQCSHMFIARDCSCCPKQMRRHPSPKAISTPSTTFLICYYFTFSPQRKHCL